MKFDFRIIMCKKRTNNIENTDARVTNDNKQPGFEFEFGRSARDGLCRSVAATGIPQP